MFKQNWERGHKYIHLNIDAVKSIFGQHFSQPTINNIHIQDNGCVNTNYQISTDKGLFLLRFNTRKSDLSQQEYLISKQLYEQLPVPKVYVAATYAAYSYSIQEFVEGRLLRDVILNEAEPTWLGAIQQAGQIVAKLSNIQFEHIGFFDDDLQPRKAISTTPLWDFAEEMLANKNVQLGLGNLLAPLKTVLAQNKNYIIKAFPATFVHGDFDPSNIIVQKQENIWSLAAVIDWEFASAGYWLWDVSNMLRYAHKLSPNYKTAFLTSLVDNGMNLPENWRSYCAAYNILSLLDILSRSNPALRPNATKDIYELVQHFIRVSRTSCDSNNF